jgi:hypothetical protein
MSTTTDTTEAEAQANAQGGTPDASVDEQGDAEAAGAVAHQISGHGDQIIEVPELLTAAECAMLIAVGEKIKFTKSSVSGGGHGRTGREDAVTNSYAVTDDPALAAMLWKRLKPLVPEGVGHLTANPHFSDRHVWTASGIHPHMRLYKYEVGESYAEHLDPKLKRISVQEDQSRVFEQSVYSLLVYLNEGFEGGETGYWPDHTGIHCRFLRKEEKQHASVKQHQVLIVPETGKAVMQDQNILHEGLPPTKNGPKYILRTDIIFTRVVPRSSKLKNAPPEPVRQGQWERLFETSCKNYAI